MKKIGLSGLVPVETRKAQVDASAAFGEEPGETVLIFSEPTAAQIFEARRLADAVKKKNPTWTGPLCQSVALMGVSHESPELECDALDFYSEIAKKNNELFFAIEGTIQLAFPDQFDFGAAIKKAKNA